MIGIGQYCNITITIYGTFMLHIYFVATHGKFAAKFEYGNCNLLLKGTFAFVSSYIVYILTTKNLR